MAIRKRKGIGKEDKRLSNGKKGLLSEKGKLARGGKITIRKHEKTIERRDRVVRGKTVTLN